MVELKKNIKSAKKSWGKQVYSDRDPNKITYLLKAIPGFMKFTKYHQIADESIRKASNFFKYERYPAGSCVYEQESTSTHFYGIISGSVKIFKATKVKKLVVKKETKKEVRGSEVHINGSFYHRITKTEIPVYEYEVVMEEFGRKTSGMCFGYDGLINKAIRTSSVICEVDTEMFTLDAANFELSFSVYNILIIRYNII